MKVCRNCPTVLLLKTGHPKDEEKFTVDLSLRVKVTKLNVS